MTWKAGDRAVIDRREVVTIDRVVRGVAIVGARKFRADGSFIGKGSIWRPNPKLEPLTPEIEAGIAAHEAVKATNARLLRAIDSVNEWRRSALGRVGRADADPADVAKAERIAAAIEAAMEDE